jgi:hypothetical protein
MLAICLLVGTLLVLVLAGTEPTAQQLAGSDSVLAAPLSRPLSDAPWSTSEKVNDDDIGLIEPTTSDIAVDPSGNAYAVWAYWPTDLSGHYDIYFSYRPAGGSWGSNVKVSDDPGREEQLYPSVAVDPSGNAYALWEDTRNGNWDIYFSYRPVGGSWGSNVKVSDDPGTAYQLVPSLAVDPSGNAYAVWEDNRNGNSDIYFSYRPAGGAWGSNVKVNDDPGSAIQYWPSLAVDPSGNAYAVWEDQRNGNGIYFSYRPASGSWCPNIKVDDAAGDPVLNRYSTTSIGVDATGNAYAVWADGRNGNYDIYFSYRPAGGSWGPNIKVNDDAGTAEQQRPSVAVDPSGNTYAVWDDERSGSEDIYSSYRPAGGCWGSSVRVNDDPGAGRQKMSSIAVDPSGNAYAVWEDYLNDSPSSGILYFSYRLPGGPHPPCRGLSYTGPGFLPSDQVLVLESDGRITMGDHVHLQLPFKNNGSATLSNATVQIAGCQDSGTCVPVSIHNGSGWGQEQTVRMTPQNIGPGQTGKADFWIYVENKDPVDRTSLVGQTWIRLRSQSGEWTIPIALSPISFSISGNQDLTAGSCLHHPDDFQIQKYAQYAAGDSTIGSSPNNSGDPDTPEQAVRNLVGRVHSEFNYTKSKLRSLEERQSDLTLLTRRGGDIGVCIHYADLTTGLLRSLGLPSRYVSAALWKQQALWFDTQGHAWAETYLNTGLWRQADSTWGRVAYESVYEDTDWTVKEAWADRFPLSLASSLYPRFFRCVLQCYTQPVNCALCRLASMVPQVAPDLSCVEDVTSRYHQNSLTVVGSGTEERLAIQVQAPTFVTRTLAFAADTGITNDTSVAVGAVTATVSLSATVDSTDALFEVFPTYQVATDLDAGETVTVTWTITPLVSGSGVPLRVSAYSGDLFAVDEKPLVVNEPGSLPDLTLDGICGLETALPGENVALTAYVLDENLQGMSDIGTVVTATVYATPTVQFTTTVNLSYSETSGMYEEVVDLPDTAPIGSYEVDFLATHSGYDPDSATTFFAVRPPLTTTLEANVDTLPVQDTLAMTVGVWDRGAVITEASVWAEMTTPVGVITAPLTVGSGDAYTLSLRPFDLRADLGGQVPVGNWVLEVTVDYQGSGASAERPITVRPTACVPLALKQY